jgi:hypothetical protein
VPGQLLIHFLNIPSIIMAKPEPQQDTAPAPTDELLFVCSTEIRFFLNPRFAAFFRFTAIVVSYFQTQ